MTHSPGTVRDAIVDYLSDVDDDASMQEIIGAVECHIGTVSPSSVRSYLNNNVGKRFVRTEKGRYRVILNTLDETNRTEAKDRPTRRDQLDHADCFKWLQDRDDCSVEAVVTDPPYGVVEYDTNQIEKLRSGCGGVWRIPPSFDGVQRSALPRFTTLSKADHIRIEDYFYELGAHLLRVVVPGANVVVASNPLLCHLVANGMTNAGLEHRGYISRLTMTMRGGDRPKNAHHEFRDVSVMPRSQWEPWVVLRRPMEGRTQDNLRNWRTGGFRRISEDRPFGDVIQSRPTPRTEKLIAPHPSLKPQKFMRQIVRASLPLGIGTVLDPFAGSGSTLAAANAVGYKSVGVETDHEFYEMAQMAIPKLAKLEINLYDDAR